MAPQSTVERARLLQGTGLEERREQLAGISTAILEAGSGPPLILLHGGIECGGVYWAPVVARLAQQHHLIVPDLPGLGESEPAPQLDTGTLASWLGALAAIRFGLRPSRRNSERFDRWAFFDLAQAHGRNPGWFEAWSLYTMSRARIPHVKRAMRQLISRCRKRVPDDVLNRIEVPTTLLWGRHDRFVSLAVGEQASKRIGWPLRVIDRAGHVPHIERPEPFLQALRATLDPRPDRSAA